jgi:hypothetical protein
MLSSWKQSEAGGGGRVGGGQAGNGGGRMRGGGQGILSTAASAGQGECRSTGLGLRRRTKNRKGFDY